MESDHNTVQYHIYLRLPIKASRPFTNVIRHLKSNPPKHIHFMSFPADSLNLPRKRTATERATNNGDPLVVRKRAREATAAPVAKKSKNVSLQFFKGII
jgi:hypothetical protein